MDVKNIFLQGTLEEEVYMTLPPCHKRENMSNLVCRLNKFIYGLKQSPRVWYEKLSQFLLSCNFKISWADTSLFIKYNENGIMVVLVYVDDIIITENSQSEIDAIKSGLKEIAHSSKGLFISQRKYVLDLLKESGKLGCKPASTPVDINVKLNTEDGELLEDINQY
jgi:Reverse transcriptase (RNA-dependent DNA polymerase)